MYYPLKGIRILDLARLIPGDLATRKLADLGADVVKLEPPGTGDYLRHIPPKLRNEPLMHWCLNRNKRSVTADLKTEEGLDLFRQLAGRADVIVEVSVPGSFQRLGIDFAELRKERPELVVCSLTGFGQNGELAVLPSHGMSMDAQAGCVVVTEYKGRPVVDYSLGSSLASELGAANAATAVCAAIYRSKTTGEGEWIDISCWDSAVEMQRLSILRAVVAEQSGEPVSSHGRTEDPRDWVLYALYRAADDRLIMFCAQEFRFWKRFCEGVDRNDLLDRWDGQGNSVDNRPNDEWLRAELVSIFASADAQSWFDRFREWQVPGALLMRPADIIRSSHFAERGLLQHTSGTLPHIADPIRWLSDGSRPGDQAHPAPPLGEHNQQVLEDWLGGKSVSQLNK